MFHEDHVIPVAMIFDEMVKKKNPNKQSIKRLLDGMHICTILKEEDHELARKEGRHLVFARTIKDAYAKAKIVLEKK